MPIELEAVTAPSAQDLIDLEKIYADRPLWMTLPELAGGPAQANARLFAARFNGRLLAAVTACPEADGWRLTQLCVRAVTRKRGVGSWLLELVAREAGRQGLLCLLDPGPDAQQAEQLLRKLPAELWTGGQIRLATR